MRYKLSRVNMTKLGTSTEDIPEGWAGHGDRELTSTLVAAEVDPTRHPLDPKNKLVFALGLLFGTVAADSGRLPIGVKSTLTGAIKKANAGGTDDQLLARAAVRALITEGLPKKMRGAAWHRHQKGGTIDIEEELIGKGNCKVIKTTERAVNIAAGFTPVDDRLQEFFPHRIAATAQCFVFDLTGEERDTFCDF